MSKPIQNKKVFIYENGKIIEKQLPVPVEMPAQFIINDRELLKIMITPIQLREYAIGFLAGQGIISSLRDIKTELIGEKKAILYFELHKEIPEHIMTTSYLNPGCGGGVSFKSIDLSKIKTKEKFKMPDIFKYMKDMLKAAELYKESGGFHTAGLASEAKILFTSEDIGRHNAVDKVIGSGLINEIDFSKSVVLSTGRITLEAVAKASRLNIPVLVTRSSPTNLAVSLAQKQGVALLGYVRGEKAKIYNGIERIIS